VLQRLGRHITEAYEHALQAENEATVAVSPTARKEWEKLARSWRMVAKGLEFLESLDRFLVDSDQAKAVKPPKKEKD
jgi:hypothetical protein